jgi:uncharacterized protein (DUF3084 family)
MTEKIQQLIEDIRLKYKTLYSQLIEERTLRLDQNAELTSLKEQNSILNNKINEFEIENLKLKLDLETIIQERIEERNSNLKIRNQEIDDLVREIEHCINQLK